MATMLMPEWILVLGIAALILVPNLGNGTFRLPIPGQSIRIPYLLGGTRFTLLQDPRIPAGIAIVTLSASLAAAVMSQITDGIFEMASACIEANGTITDCGVDRMWMLKVDTTARIFECIFLAACLLATLANMNRLQATPLKSIAARAYKDAVAEAKRQAKLYNNRRQVDFYVLLLMVALGMSVVAISANLFVLFIGLELASLATYVLVAFHKETKEGSEAGMKYFIVGSVSSAAGLYGLSMLYLWNGNLAIHSGVGLAASWEAMAASGTWDALPVLGLVFMLAAFGFKVSAVPFHFATPDAYDGASGPVAGVLSTASKAMGFLVLMRVLLSITLADDGGVWYCAIGAIAAITMTWGNIAALGSRNPKRMLAYSSVAHAGYILAAIAAIGAVGPGDAATLIAAAVIFHLAVMVSFKLGAFLVISLLEMEGRGHDLSDYHGLARREPIIAVSMFVFMLALAGVPPLSGFLSKLLMVNGIISATVGASSASTLAAATGSLSWVFWLAILIFMNSAVSVFYYLRIGVVMFFEESDRKMRMSRAPFTRIAIMLCLMGAVVFGFGPLANSLIDIVMAAAAGLF